MILGVALVAIFCLGVAMVVMTGLERGPSPSDVAVSYELAWDRLDFPSLWALSGHELRDGLDRRGFIKAKRDAYADTQGLARLAADVTVVDSAFTEDDATVITQLVLRDGTTVNDEVILRRRNLRWEVVAYSLQRPAASGKPAQA